MKYVRVIRLHICRVEKFTVLNNEVIIWGYNPGVVRVIDAELSELWGYKVITPGLSELLMLSYRNYGVITPGVVGVTGL